MPPTETPTSVTETTRLVDNEDVEDPGWFAVCAASLAYLIYWIVMRAK